MGRSFLVQGCVFLAAVGSPGVLGGSPGDAFQPHIPRRADRYRIQVPPSPYGEAPTDGKVECPSLQARLGAVAPPTISGDNVEDESGEWELVSFDNRNRWTRLPPRQAILESSGGVMTCRVGRRGQSISVRMAAPPNMTCGTYRDSTDFYCGNESEMAAAAESGAVERGSHDRRRASADARYRDRRMRGRR